MGLTVKRIAIRIASSQILVEYVETSSKNETGGGAGAGGGQNTSSSSTSRILHQVITLQREALNMDIASLGQQLRVAMPHLFPIYVSDEKLFPLLRSLQLGSSSSSSSSHVKGNRSFTIPTPSSSTTSSSSTQQQNQNRQISSSSSSSTTIAAAAAIPAVIASIGDLQRVGPAALQAAKAKMEVVFEANKLKPGDPGFEYDKRAEFAPATEESEWDD